MPKLDMLPRDRALDVRSAAVDPEARTVSFIFATETPCRTWDPDLGDHYEILDCTDQACDLSWLNSGNAPLLRQHNDDEQIGVHKSATFENRVGKAVAKFSSSPVGQQEFADVADGIRRNFSVRYQPYEMVLQSSGDDGDFYRVTKWKPLENSIVSIPADPNCNVSRAVEKATTHQVLITNPNHIAPMTTRSRKFFEAPTERGGGGTDPKPRELSPAELETIKRQAVKEAGEDFAKRQREMDEIVESVKNRDKKDFSELARKFALDGKSTDEFCRALVGSDKYVAFTPQEQDADGKLVIGDRVPDPREQQRGAPQIISPGDTLIHAKGFKEFAKNRRRGDVFTSDVPDPRQRATTTSGFTSIDKLQVIPLVGVRRLTIKDLMAGGTTDNTNIRYIQEVSFTNYATTVLEGGLKPEATFSLNEVNAYVIKIAVITKMTDELLSDYPAVASYINQRLPYMVELTEEDQLLNGDGSTGNLTGLLNTAGLLTQAKGGDNTADAIFKAITKIRFGTGLATGGWEPDGIVMNPLDWQNIRLTKDGNNQYFGGGPFTGAYGNAGMIQAEMLWGKPVVVTPAIAAGKALVGNFALGAQYFQRQGMTIDMTNSNEDDFKYNRITLRAEIREALCVYRPTSFCTVTGL